MKTMFFVTLVLLAAAVLGFTTGYLPGHSGFSDVFTVGLPIAITGSSGGLLTYKLVSRISKHTLEDFQWNPQYALVCAMAVMFSVFLLAGANIGARTKFIAELEAPQQTYRYGMQSDLVNIEVRRRYLQICSREQWILNADRNDLGLPPLHLEAFCPNALAGRVGLARDSQRMDGDLLEQGEEATVEAPSDQ